MDFTLYARKEPTNDAVMLREVEAGYSPAQMPNDVVLYRDENCTDEYGRFPWHYTQKPRKSDKTYIVNCFRWNIVWVDVTEHNN